MGRIEVPLPSQLAQVVNAVIELASNRPRWPKMAERVLVDTDVPHRWRVWALSVVLCVPDPDATGETEMLLASADWSEAMDSLAFMPKAARRLIVDHLGIDPAAHPGLRLSSAPMQPDVHVELTKRQREVLVALDSTDTLAEIAKRQFVGVETVRSTAKELYRRMGVHDRESAVRMAKAIGLL